MDKINPLELTSKWLRTRYYIQDGYILPIPGAEWSEYDPWDYYNKENAGIPDDSLHIKFLNINLTDHREIEQFCSTYGLLGLRARDVATDEFIRKNQEEYRVPNYPRELIPDNVPPNLRGPLMTREPLEEFINEVNVFRWVTQINEGLRKFDIELLRDALGGNLDKSDEMVFDRATILYLQTVNNRLRCIRPKIIRYTDETKSYNILRWEFTSLLDNIYMMHAQSTQENRSTRKCKNEKCNKWFSTDKEIKVYCSKKCGHDQSVRDLRNRRRRQKKGDDNK